MASSESTLIVSEVKDYYGKRVKKSTDLQTNVCTVGSGKGMTPNAKKAFGLVHEEVKRKYYGCGTVVPEAIEGCHILDLGCGAGVDVFVLSKLVGAEGFITGVDMTEEQLEVARRYIQYHADVFEYKKPNIKILQGQIEDLEGAGVAPGSVDVIVSNCVVNLAANKEKVLTEAFKVLKDGGELFFSDIYADKEVPEALRRDAVLWGECLSGALHWRRLHELASSVGFATPRLVRANTFEAGNAEIEAKLKGFHFVSATYRLFKLPEESEETKTPHQVVYNGEIDEYESSWSLDCNWTFPSGFVTSVDAETAAILMTSRFKSEFEFNGLPKDDDGSKNGSTADDDPFALSTRTSSGDRASGACCPPSSSSGGKCC